VICEIMKDDGTMARMGDLIPFARKHGLKMGTIRDLIEYRRRHDHLVEQVAETRMTSDYGGEWKLLTYRNKIDRTNSYVLQKGAVVPGTPTLTRVHAISLFDDMLGRPGPKKRTLQRAMSEVGKAGAGVIVLLVTPPSDQPAEGAEMDLRAYGVGAQILADLGVHEMILLTNAHRNLVALDGYGLNVVGEQAIPPENA